VCLGAAAAVGCMQGGGMHQWCWMGCKNVRTVIVSVFVVSVVCAMVILIKDACVGGVGGVW